MEKEAHRHTQALHSRGMEITIQKGAAKTMEECEGGSSMGKRNRELKGKKRRG